MSKFNNSKYQYVFDYELCHKYYRNSTVNILVHPDFNAWAKSLHNKIIRFNTLDDSPEMMNYGDYMVYKDFCRKEEVL